MMEGIWLGVCCLSGWLILPTCPLRQYYFIKEPLSWNEAQTYCRQEYTDLATMESATVMSQLQSLLSSSGHKSGVWFGLYSKINWKWSDGFTGSGAEYRDWGTNEPQLQINHFCVVKDEKWYIRDCGSVLPFICYNGTQENPQFVPVTKAMNWSDAQKYCRENYVDLATVTNATQDQQVKLLQPQSQPAWIGLFRDPELYFSDGSTLSWSYFDHFKFPIGSNTVLCATTALQRSMIWRLWYCEQRKPFLCHVDTVKRQVVKLRIDLGDSSVDLNDPAVKAEILEKLQQRLKENRVNGVTLKWREQPDGKEFHKEETEGTHLCVNQSATAPSCV